MSRTAVLGILAAVVLAAVGVSVFRTTAPPEPSGRPVQEARPTQAPPTQEPQPPKPPPAVVRAPTPASAPTAPPADDEASLMARLRGIQTSDPASAIALARDGNLRFPDSPDAPERTSILIHALSAQGKWPEARGIAEDMVNRYPESDWVHEVEGFTGAHRHRNAHVGADGGLEYD